MVPLTVAFAKELYTDGVTITKAEFYQKMAASETLPKTSQPSPQAFVEAFRNGLAEKGRVFAILLSSGLSGTYQSACLARTMLNDDERIEILDSRTVSAGTAIQVLTAARLAVAGVSVRELVAKTSQLRDEMQTFFTLESIENLVKGGRLSRLQGMVASLINLKPVFRDDGQGRIILFEKITGRQRALQRLIEVVGEKGRDLKQRIVGISHANCLNVALDVEQRIKELYHPQETLIVEMGSIAGTYAGVGGIIISF